MTSLKQHNGQGPAILTRLGRAVRAAHGTAGPDAPQHHEQHRTVNWLRDVTLGGQDSLVSSDTTRETISKVSFKPTSRRSSHLRTDQCLPAQRPNAGPTRPRTAEHLTG